MADFKFPSKREIKGKTQKSITDLLDEEFPILAEVREKMKEVFLRK